MSDRPLTKSMANKAGERIAGSDKPSADDLAIVARWRAAHLPALETALGALCRVTEGDAAYVLAGRLKKLATIVDKLGRDRGTGRHSLKRMGDIAGCRVIVKDLGSQRDLCARVLSMPEFSSAKVRDYVKEPRETGYAALHIYADFEGALPGTPLSVEVQVRTVRQHLWATSVEIYDSLMGTRLKFGSSDDVSSRMFRVLSTILRLHDIADDSPLLDNRQDEIDALATRAANLLRSDPGILGMLEAADDSLFVLPTPPCSVGDLFLLDADFEEQLVGLMPVIRDRAVLRYGEVERLPHHDVVLVSTDDVDQLRLAYPNYFMDVRAFVGLLTDIVGGAPVLRH